MLRIRGVRAAAVIVASSALAMALALASAVTSLPGAPAGAPAWASVSPINPSNTPTPIPGATNGELPPGDLVGVAHGCQAARSAGPSLGLLLAEAKDRGVLLGTEECYRSLQGQQQESASWTAAGNSACAAPVQTNSSGQP